MTKHNRLSIDVILCSYNQEQYIGKAIESIITQQVDADVKVIIADDCSTDHTLDIIKCYEPQSPFPFEYLSDNHNLGLKANYKRAFSKCDADFIAILEGDDWWCEKWHLAQNIKFLDTHSRYSMSFNSITYYYPEKERYVYPKWPFGDIGYVKIKLRHQISLGNQIGNLSACVFRAELIHKLPDEFYNLNFADWDLGIMMALRGPIAQLKASSSIYRINEKGLWSSLSEEEKVTSELESLKQIEPLIPSYCRCYIKHYQALLTKKDIIQFPMPLRYSVKKTLKQIGRLFINK